MAGLNNVKEVAGCLEANGYAVQVESQAIYAGVGGSEDPFTAVLTIDPKRRELVINCQLATLRDLDQDHLTATAIAALDANTRVRPYAYAIISDADDPLLEDEQTWPLVLTDSVPLGDLCEAELMANLDALWQAIHASRNVFETGL